jgi:hypothetical protein
VVGLSGEEGFVTLFRRGGVSEIALRDVIKTLVHTRLELAASLSARSSPNSPNLDVPEQAQVAPGQLITHYSPEGVESFLWEEHAR